MFIINRNSQLSGRLEFGFWGDELIWAAAASGELGLPPGFAERRCGRAVLGSGFRV